MFPSGYDDIWPESTHCYWIATEQVTWEDAKVKCKEDGAELACFSDQQERDAVANQCDQCWVGYTWKGGRFYLFSCLIRVGKIYHPGLMLVINSNYYFLFSLFYSVLVKYYELVDDSFRL